MTPVGKVRLPREVRSDLPWDSIVAPPGIYEARANQHGAMSVLTPSGHWLGIKPGEWQWEHPSCQPRHVQQGLDAISEMRDGWRRCRAQRLYLHWWRSALLRPGGKP
jgi:hypothetical protein